MFMLQLMFAVDSWNFLRGMLIWLSQEALKGRRR